MYTWMVVYVFAYKYGFIDFCIQRWLYRFCIQGWLYRPLYKILNV